MNEPRRRGRTLSALGESRTASAAAERMRLVEHYAQLQMWCQLLISQVRRLGGAPLPMPVGMSISDGEVEDAAKTLALDLARNPPPPDIEAENRARKIRAEPGMNAQRVMEYLRSDGQEFTATAIANALGMTYPATAGAIYSSGKQIVRRQVGRIVFYRSA